MAADQAIENGSGWASAKKAERRICFEYSLSYDEAFDAFLLLSARGSKRHRNAVAVGLIVLAAMLTVLYAFCPYNIEYFMLALLALATFGGVVYYPRIKAHAGAKRVEKVRGVYRVELRDDGYIQTPGGSLLELSGDKDARAFETDTIFVLRPDRQSTFCLPKRIMTDSEIDLTRRIVAEHVKLIRTESQNRTP